MSSIAISTVIKPSRILSLIQIIICIGCLFVGGIVYLEFFDNFDTFNKLLFILANFLIGIFVIFFGVFKRKLYKLSISGDGQIRIICLNKETNIYFEESDNISPNHNNGTVELMAHSTIWPYLLLLRLKTNNDHVIILPILPDCVSSDGFRKLSVACRWIAARNNNHAACKFL